MTEQVRARHILVPTVDEAMALQHRISNGEDFGELAKQFSKCPSNVNGGDLGFFGRGQMVKPFEDVAFTMGVGDVSTPPVETQFGYHLIQRTQ